MLKAFTALYIIGFSITSGLSATVLIQNDNSLKNFTFGLIIGAGASVVFPVLIASTAVAYPFIYLYYF